MLRAMLTMILALLLIVFILIQLSLNAGTQVAASEMLYMDLQDERTQIVRRDVGRNMHLALTSSPTRSSLPTWSPDGSTIAFIHWERLDANQRLVIPNLYIANADDGKTKRLVDVSRMWETNGIMRGNILWSPDGTRIAYFFPFDNDFYIWVTDTDGNELLHFVEDRGMSLDTLVWGRDNETLYVTAFDGEEFFAWRILVEPDARMEDWGIYGSPILRGGGLRYQASAIGGMMTATTTTADEIWLYDFDAQWDNLLIRETLRENFIVNSWTPTGDAVAIVTRNWDTRAVFARIMSLDGEVLQTIPIDENFFTVRYWSGFHLSPTMDYLYGFIIGRKECVVDVKAEQTHCHDTGGRVSYWHTFKP